MILTRYLIGMTWCTWDMT